MDYLMKGSSSCAGIVPCAASCSSKCQCYGGATKCGTRCQTNYS